MSSPATLSVVSKKDVYAIGEIPPLGAVPEKMHAWCIRQDRHGAPDTAMQIEIVPTWAIGEDECLILVMAAGVKLQWRVGGTRQAHISHRRPQESFPHRGL